MKWLYGRTNKCEATRQIGQCVRQLEHAQLVADHDWLKTESKMWGVSVREQIDQDLEKCYHLSNSWNNPINLYSFIHKNQGDPAFNRFIPKLKDHLLGHLLERDYEGDTYGEFTDAEHNTVCIASKWIYQCKTFQINYTTYDIRCDRDTINTQLYPDIMVNSLEMGPNAQPYWYACIIGIFHAIVSLSHPELEVTARSQRQMDFL